MRSLFARCMAMLILMLFACTMAGAQNAAPHTAFKHYSGSFRAPVTKF